MGNTFSSRQNYVKTLTPSDPLTVTRVATKPIEGQKPGTSGLRKKTKVFMSEHYLQNFVQAVFDALVAEKVRVRGGTLVISGDGRFFNPEAVQVIIKMAAAAGVGRVWCGTDGLLSTPALSAVIRTRGTGFEPFGGFILSASHNPGGPDEDFGIKYNTTNGGPSPEKLTDLIYKNTTEISSFKICAGLPTFDLSAPAVFEVGSAGGKVLAVEVFDATEDHVKLLQKVFDFQKIKALFERTDFSFTYDSMNGVQGPYAVKIFHEMFGAPREALMNAVPKDDFGGHSTPSHGHADPNLTHAVELVAVMGLNKDGRPVKTKKPPPTFGAAADGDADRNMIMGSQFFCSPSDSLAVIVANSACIPWYAKGLKGCARSMPTSCALDRVAEKLGIPCFEVPTGWKLYAEGGSNSQETPIPAAPITQRLLRSATDAFRPRISFGNLMDSGTRAFPGKKVYTPFICGEESFGTGGDHVREKDGMWAVLAWLQILASKNEDVSKPIVGVADICQAHWKEFGRNYYARYDYEGVDKPAAEKMMAEMVAAQPSLIGTTHGGMTIVAADMFAYNDPVDGSVSKNQGVRCIFEDGSRFVFRLSGTGVAGATVRMYLEKYEPPTGDVNKHAFDVVKPIAVVALKISKLAEYTGRKAPTVIT